MGSGPTVFTSTLGGSKLSKSLTGFFFNKRQHGEKGGGGGNDIKEKNLPASTKNKPAGLPVRRTGGGNKG